MSSMVSTAGNSGNSSIIQRVNELLREGSSTSDITWAILGGKSFMAKKPVSGIEFLRASEDGISKQSILNLAAVMNIPMKDMAALLNISSKTLSRRRKT